MSIFAYGDTNREFRIPDILEFWNPALLERSVTDSQTARSIAFGDTPRCALSKSPTSLSDYRHPCTISIMPTFANVYFNRELRRRGRPWGGGGVRGPEFRKSGILDFWGPSIEGQMVGCIAAPSYCGYKWIYVALLFRILVIEIAIQIRIPGVSGNGGIRRMFSAAKWRVRRIVSPAPLHPMALARHI